MRLICPGCAAQYDVDDSAIPPEGRDVQCSNCGHAWFQRGPAPEAAPDTDDSPTPRPDGDAPPAPAAPAVDAGRDEGDDAPQDTAEDMPGKKAQPRKVDEAVLSVLREEAEREARARRADAAALETQPDLGAALQPQAAPRRTVPRGATIGEPVQGVRPRRAVKPGTPGRRGAATEAPGDDGGLGDGDADGLGRPGSDARSNRLPDIEEINSTLRGSAERDDAESLPPDGVAEARTQRRGFRLGLGVVVGLGVLALLLYALAGTIAAAVPALAPAMESYAAAMDGLRFWLSTRTEAAMRAVLDRIT